MSEGILVQLGIPKHRAVWQDVALCQNTEMPINQFFDDYEHSSKTARAVDALCAVCPVKNECLNEAIDNNETGVWGGVYLKNGHYDPQRNKHKPVKEQIELEDYIG